MCTNTFPLKLMEKKKQLLQEGITFDTVERVLCSRLFQRHRKIFKILLLTTKTSITASQHPFSMGPIVTRDAIYLLGARHLPPLASSAYHCSQD